MGVKEKCELGLGGKTMKRGVDGCIKLRLIFRKWDAEAWTGLIPAQERDRWRDLVNAAP
jgi:hypothetical protein